MRIAIPSMGQGNMDDVVSAHFGKCESYVVVDIEEQEIKSIETIPDNGHSSCAAPVELLSAQGVDVMLATGMGKRPYQAFKLHGIEVRGGVAGTIEDAITAYLAGDTLPLREDSLCSCTH